MTSASIGVVPYLPLNDGTKMPAVGMGCWMGEIGGGERVGRMVEKALKLGYRHIDTAAGYGNEEMVGKAIKESGIPRELLYITTKLSNAAHDKVVEGFEASLAKLDCGYIDMYLMHWPVAVVDGKVLPPTASPTIIDTWLSMQSLLQTHKSQLRSIGVSNFSIKTFTQLFADERVTVIPATNQVELHPYLPQTALKEYCEQKGILLTAYSPLGQPPATARSSPDAPPLLLGDSVVVSLAEKYGATPAQILLNWGIQRGTVVIPKSENEGRMKVNITIVHLDESDMAALNALHDQPGKHRSLLTYHQKGDNGSGVFGWSYEWLGWEGMGDGGVIG